MKFTAPNMVHITLDTDAEVFIKMPKPVTLYDMTHQYIILDVKRLQY